MLEFRVEFAQSLSLVRVEVLAGGSHGVEPDGGGDQHAAAQRPRPEPAARLEVLLHLVHQQHLGAVDAPYGSVLPRLQKPLECLCLHMGHLVQ